MLYDLMQRGAAIVGESVHDFQAITWLVWRSRWWKAGVNDHDPTRVPLFDDSFMQ